LRRQKEIITETTYSTTQAINRFANEAEMSFLAARELKKRQNRVCRMERMETSLSAGGEGRSQIKTILAIICPSFSALKVIINLFISNDNNVTC